MRDGKTEAQIQFEILQAWGARPDVFTWRQNTGAAMVKGRMVRFGVPGTPDVFMVCGPQGRLVGVECKSATGRQSPEQKRFQTAMERRGGLYVLARSLADVDAALSRIGITR